MSFALLHKLITYLIACLGMAALTFSADIDLYVRVLLWLGVLVSWFLEPPFVARSEWTRLLTTAVVTGFFVQLLRALTQEPVLDIAIEYAGFLQVSRLLQRRVARDHQHVVVLAFIHLVAASVLTEGIGYAITFIGFVVVTPWMLALTHLRVEIEANYAAKKESASEVQRVLRSRRIAGPAFLLGTMSLAIPLFLLTGTFFLLFPRVGTAGISFGASRGASVTGFGRDVELGGFGAIRNDPTVVIRVTRAGGGPVAAKALRLRGTSFDRYDGRRWTRTTPPGRPLMANGRDYFQLHRPRAESDLAYQIVVDPLDEPVVFLPDAAVGLMIPSRDAGGRKITQRLTRSMGLDVRHGHRGTMTYSVWADPDAILVYDEPLEEELRQRYLQMPERHMRLRELSERITATASNDQEKAARILTYLRDSKTFAYTLKQPDTGAFDPLDVFLFEVRSGHCEYFSTAMAIMLRAAGIPARNVTGFLGGTPNPYGGYYSVRQSDAHSWVEAHIDGAWQAFDPTPAGREALGPTPSGWVAELQAVLDALRVRWADYVVDYDLEVQINALKGMARWWRSMRRSEGGRSIAFEASPASEVEADSVMPSVWPLFGWLAALAIAIFVLRSWSRRPTSVAEITKVYARLEQKLRDRGYLRGKSETPLAFAERLRVDGLIYAEEVLAITRAYMAVRYGGVSLHRRQRAQLYRRIRRLGGRKRIESQNAATGANQAIDAMREPR
ncbi:MAG: DUF3488 and transglutaminase-like domain-containing protein [Myxococcota bacterium]